MLRTLSLAFLAAASFAAPLFHATRQAGAAPPAPAAPCVNLFQNEPLVVFDISGFTLTGLLHKHFSLYSSGVATLAEAGGGTPLFPFGSKADVAFVTPEEARKLWSAVVAAGAFSNCDILEWVSDVPLTTVTVYRGETDSRARTYSYYLPSKPSAAAVQALIEEFIQKAFPNF